MMSMRFAAEKGGRMAYLTGASLSANPYTYGSCYARLWATSWLNAWLNCEPVVCGG